MCMLINMTKGKRKKDKLFVIFNISKVQRYPTGKFFTSQV
jgi:hypothetical protein